MPSSDCAIGGTSKPFPKLKRSVIAIKLQAPIMIRTLMVPPHYINVMIESIQIDGYEILLGDIPAQALALDMLSSFADIANGMVANDCVTVVLRRLKSYDKPYAPFMVASKQSWGKRLRTKWKWKTFPTASRRRPLQFGVSATKISYERVGSDLDDLLAKTTPRCSTPRREKETRR